MLECLLPCGPTPTRTAKGIDVSTSRRDLLKAALATAAAGWSFRSWASPGNWPGDYDRVVLLSDTHISKSWDDTESHLESAVEFIRELPIEFGRLATSLVAVVGDASRAHGLNADYEMLQAITKPIRQDPPPVFRVLPGVTDHRGNLDDRFLTFTPHDLWRGIEHLGLASCDWYLLDSLRRTGERVGEIGPEQLARLDKMLAEEPDRPACVVLHHPPLPPPADGAAEALRGSEEAKAGRGDAPATRRWPRADAEHGPPSALPLADGPALMELLLGHTRVKAVFHGGLHAWGHREVDGLHVVSLPATSYVFDPDEALGFVIVEPGPDLIEVTRYGFVLQKPEKLETVRLVWR